MSSNWKSVLVSPDTPIIEAIRIIDGSALQIALVVDGQGRLLGTVTDGDIRRGILQSVPTDAPVSRIMCDRPTAGSVHDDRETLLTIMKRKVLRQIPILDDSGRIVGLETMIELIQGRDMDNPVVLMAGGLGNRLRPLTEDCPKPLLRLGDKPILEIILENFLNYGFKNFFISVNYKAEMIEEHFGDGSRWGASLTYLREDRPLGTAGALGLLPAGQSLPVLVMNGDLLTKVNFAHLLEFHRESGSAASMCVRDYGLQVPFGVAKVEKGRLVGLEEKPCHNFFVNAGIYVLNPEVLDRVRPDTAIDMTTLLEGLVRDGGEVTVFPVREYWLDIGRLSDYEQAKGEYCQHFNDE
ncbi:MAG: nucleotidyltransferase family protein [Desulfovibrionaceae bacterium]|nr:nucleotidyltransferase family protein [Desulfovibrionaceae bacterium]MDD4952845.1 nucleotidyltransferase family protein [Desulfovibrionaceae bacterium]